MSNQSNKLIPKLRFPEFIKDGEWEEKKLNEIADCIENKVGKRQLTTVSISAGVGFVSQAEKFSRDISGKQYKNYIFLRNGEFAYNKGNSKKFPQGCIYKLKGFKEAAAPNAFICFRFRNNVVADFYIGYFDNNYHGKQLQKFITSGARMDGLLNISPDDFFSITLPTPKNKEEQQKIASCLSSLDELIEAHSQKLEALKNQKKGLMQNLFPQEGEKVPKLRFPEFAGDGEWEEKRLGDIGEPLMCKRIFKEQTTTHAENSIPFYKIGTFGGVADSFISMELYNEYKSKYSFPKVGEILISAAGTIGRLVVYDGLPAYFQDSNIVWISNDEGLVFNGFLLHSYSTLRWQTSDGGIIRRLYNSDLKNMRILFPTEKKEQHKIASCLFALDNLITTQAEKVEQLKFHKKGLMQGLFPKINT